MKNILLTSLVTLLSAAVIAQQNFASRFEKSGGTEKPQHMRRESIFINYLPASMTRSIWKWNFFDTILLGIEEEV